MNRATVAAGASGTCASKSKNTVASDQLDLSPESCWDDPTTALMRAMLKAKAEAAATKAKMLAYGALKRARAHEDTEPRVPITGLDKRRLEINAEKLMRRTDAGRAYGALTAKAVAVLKALLVFHNGENGWCFPSYDALAEKAGCARSTVGRALKMLEAAGLLTWTNRWKWMREAVEGLVPGTLKETKRAVRTSNGYVMMLPPAIGPTNTSPAWRRDAKLRRKMPDLPREIAPAPVNPSKTDLRSGKENPNIFLEEEPQIVVDRSPLTFSKSMKTILKRLIKTE